MNYTPVLPNHKDVKEIMVILFATITPHSISKLWYTVEQSLANSSKFEKMTLVLSSTGGSAHWAGTMYRYLKNMPITIHTHAIGAVSSAALLLYCLGKERYTDPHAMFTLHPAAYSIAEPGMYDAASLQEVLAQLQIQDELILESLASVTDKDRRIIENDVRRRLVLPAKEAKDYKLVTDIREKLERNDESPIYRISETHDHLPVSGTAAFAFSPPTFNGGMQMQMFNERLTQARVVETFC